MAVNPLSRREVLKFGAYTTVGGVLTPGISLAQAVVTDTKGIIARDEQIESGGTNAENVASSISGAVRGAARWCSDSGVPM